MDVRQGKFVGVLDRKQVPSVKDFENVSLPKPETIILPNGIPVYIIRMGDQDVCRIDVIFSAGRYNEENYGSHNDKPYAEGRFVFNEFVSDCGESGLLWCVVTDIGIFS